MKTKNDGRRLDLELFNYGIDLHQVKNVIEEKIEESKAILKKPEKHVGISVLEESGYKVMINIWLKSHGFKDAKLIFQENLLEHLKASGIILPAMAAK